MDEDNFDRQLKLANWGSILISKFESYFDTTDNCDLTLSFPGGNAILKVHRLVINACTDYFNSMEQTCQTVDDVLEMPPDVEIDVMVPIIRFMYTGVIKYHSNNFNKICEQVKLMKFTTLLKLLEAQNNEPTSPRNPRSRTPLPPKVAFHTIRIRKRPNPYGVIKNLPKPTRFYYPEKDLEELNTKFKTSSITTIDYSQFGHISLTNEPLVTYKKEINYPKVVITENVNLVDINKGKKLKKGKYEDDQWEELVDDPRDPDEFEDSDDRDKPSCSYSTNSKRKRTG